MADRYWVGGTAAWDGTAGTKWALTSGGAGGQAIPTPADDVFFSSLSTGTCTISTGNTGAKSINCTGFTGTLTGTAAITVSGSVTLVAGMTYGYTGIMTLDGTGTITSAGKTFGSVVINGAGITVTLGGACIVGASSTFTLTQGTLALAGFTLTSGIFSSNNTNTRSISFGTGSINLTNQGFSTVVSMANMTNFSWTGSTGNEGFSHTRALGTGTGAIATGSTAGGTVSNAVNLTLLSASAGGTVSLTAGSYIKNLTIPNSTTTLSLSAGAYNACGNLEITDTSFSGSTALSPTFLASGTLRSGGNTLGDVTINGSGITVTIVGTAVTLGTTRTFTLTQGTLNLNNISLSTGAFSSNNSNTRAIAFGFASIALTSTTSGATVLSMADATNFTYTGTGGFTRSMVANTTFVFGTTSGSTTNAPNLTLTGSTFSASITTGSWFRNFNCSGTSSSVNGSFNLAGNLIISPSAVYSVCNPTFRATTSFNTLGNPSFGVITVNGAGITVSLSSTGAGTTAIANIVLTEGTLNITTNLTAVAFSSSNSNVRALTLTAGITFTISGSGASAWNTATSTNLTFTPNTATISMTSASAKTFAGGSLTYYNLRQGGAGTLTVSGSNTFNDITNTVQPATVTFTAGTTQTVSNFSLSGTAASKITINSSTPGSQFNLSDASGAVAAQNLRIQDSNATGGAGWYAFNSTNLGNSTGWNFQSPNMFAFLI